MKNTELLGPTKSVILNYLLEKKRTAKELAGILNVQVSAARKHLETMLQWNIVTEHFEQEGFGRPKKFYALTEEGRELFPRQYETILNAILKSLTDGKTKGVAEAVVRDVATDIVRQLDIQGDGKRNHIELLTEGLNKFGFDATFKETRTSYVLSSHNCPLHKTATEHPKLVCQGLHSEIIKRATRSKNVNLISCLMSGDSSCRHVIEK